MKLVKVTTKKSIPHSVTIEFGPLQLLQIKVYLEDALKQQTQEGAKRNIEKYIEQIEEISNSLMSAI